MLGVAIKGLAAEAVVVPPTLPGKPLLSNAKFGVFVHYVHGLTPKDATGAKFKTIDEFADALDVEALAETAKQAGAEYLVFTTYHCGIRILYPSKVWGGVFPDKVSRRDVIGELADAVRKRGMSLVLYVHPNDRHDLTQVEQQKLIDLGHAESILTRDAIWLEKTGDKRFTGLRGADAKWNAFYFKQIEEIGQRYGSRLAGYWQDGPGPDGVTVRAIMQKYTPNAAIWLNSAATRADLPPATLLGGEYLAKPSLKAEARTSSTCAMQNSITANGDWWASQKTVLYPLENLFRMTVTMAATKGQEHGGFLLAAGPYADNSWGPGMIDTLKAHGALMRRFGPAIYGTLPSTAFVTTPSNNSQPAWGVATESPDGGIVYAHVLRPIAGSRALALGTPAGGRKFTAARLLEGKATVQLSQDATGVTLTLPAGVDWDPLDTVIVLRATS